MCNLIHLGFAVIAYLLMPIYTLGGKGQRQLFSPPTVSLSTSALFPLRHPFESLVGDVVHLSKDVHFLSVYLLF